MLKFATQNPFSIMDRKSFIEKVAAETGISQEECSGLLDNMREILGRNCSQGVSVALPAFGTFEPRRRLEREALHPATGKRLLIPPRVVLTFRPSGALKQRINEQKEP